MKYEKIAFHEDNYLAPVQLPALYGKLNPYGTTTFKLTHQFQWNWFLSYRFYPHFHPYVTALVRRLIEKSVAGLQAIDTEYGLRVQLSQDANATPLGTGLAPVALKSGNVINVIDGGTLSSDGKLVRVAGIKLFSVADELAAPQAADNSITLPAGKPVVLTAKSPIRLGPDEPILTLSADTTAIPMFVTPKPLLYEEFFQAMYKPGAATPESEENQVGVFIDTDYPAKELDFATHAPYGLYNWELFYHIPIMIGIHLSKNQRFAEARQWFQYIFDPTDDSAGSTPERFWKVKPFQTTQVKSIEDILINLTTDDDTKLRQDTLASIEDWKANPFRPHLVAATRQTAYMYKAVMAYLDNLIAWGDSLFRQDTGESIDEALTLYIEAANILGARPQAVPKKASVSPQTYKNLRGKLDAFGDVLIVPLETEVPFAQVKLPTAANPTEPLNSLRSVVQTLYFCIPHNDNLLAYWDTIADRLFKIRNSLNFQGIFRQLPLFEPPIDPALLARAAAAGLDVGAIVSGLNQPLPLVRFQLLVQNATEIAQEVKSLGNNLLLAMEKHDNEALAILRAQHETNLLQLAEVVKYAQLQEAIKAREGLEKTLDNAVQRYKRYERLLGKQESEIKIPDIDALDAAGFDKFKFQASEDQVLLRDIGVDIAQDLGASGGKLVSSFEAEELSKTELSHQMQGTIRASKLMAQMLGMIPDLGIDLHFWGLGGHANIIGGQKLSAVASFAADVAQATADNLNYQSSRASKIGGFARREEDWAFQSNLAAGEITQIFKQIRAAQIREAIAQHEWQNHQTQIKHAQAIEQFLTDEKIGKKTNQAFYAWMKREVKDLYGQCFEFAFDAAKKAERALQHELGDPGLTYLQYGYLSGKEGLLAGEKLFLDIKRMEMAYHELNAREYELTKHVSLLQVDPQALLELRASGSCTFSLPEELFDLDTPGHYFRRIKSVSVSVPCVVGPYTSINCTLTLQKGTIRKKAIASADAYAPADDNDDRFDITYGSLESIVTSTGQNDSGMFETNLREERYLPFEGSGVISTWQLELPAQIRQFDYDTITDVILHVRYTAREGGVALRSAAVGNLEKQIGKADTVGSLRLFSLRHEFPSEWSKFKIPPQAGQTANLILTIRPEHFPFWSQQRLQELRNLTFSKITSKPDGTGTVDAVPVTALKHIKADNTEEALSLDNLKKIDMSQLPLPLTLRFSFADNNFHDLWFALAWGGGGN